MPVKVDPDPHTAQSPVTNAWIALSWRNGQVPLFGSWCRAEFPQESYCDYDDESDPSADPHERAFDSNFLNFLEFQKASKYLLERNARWGISPGYVDEERHISEDEETYEERLDAAVLREETEDRRLCVWFSRRIEAGSMLDGSHGG